LMNSSRDVRLFLPSVFVTRSDRWHELDEGPDMPTLMVRCEIDDNAVDDGSKVETAVAANKHGPNGIR
jgi:hypothetical protein